MAIRKLKKENKVTLILRGTSPEIIPTMVKVSRGKDIMVKTPADGWKKASVLMKYFK